MAKKVLTGNQAVLEGALKAGLNFYSGYPITPSSEIMEKASEIAVEKDDFNFLIKLYNLHYSKLNYQALIVVV